MYIYAVSPVDLLSERWGIVFLGIYRPLSEQVVEYSGLDVQLSGVRRSGKFPFRAISIGIESGEAMS